MHATYFINLHAVCPLQVKHNHYVLVRHRALRLPPQESESDAESEEVGTERINVGRIAGH